MSIREQIKAWCRAKGLRFVDPIGYTLCGCDEIDFQMISCYTDYRILEKLGILEPIKTDCEIWQRMM